jgi:hypothetical protein
MAAHASADVRSCSRAGTFALHIGSAGHKLPRITAQEDNCNCNGLVAVTCSCTTDVMVVGSFIAAAKDMCSVLRLHLDAPHPR